MKRALPAVALMAAGLAAVVYGQQPASSASAAKTSPAATAGQARPIQPAASHPAAAATMSSAEQNALVKQYCVTCHNDRNKDRTSGLSFQSFDAANVTDHADVAEKMIRR